MVSMAEPSRLIVGISGASGVIHEMGLLQALKKIPVESHLVMTRAAEVAVAHKTPHEGTRGATIGRCNLTRAEIR